jgi:hypothetical protein
MRHFSRRGVSLAFPQRGSCEWHGLSIDWMRAWGGTDRAGKDIQEAKLAAKEFT